MRSKQEYYYGESVLDTAIRVYHEDGQVGYGAWGRQVVNRADEVVGFEGDDPSDSYGIQINGARIRSEE